MEVRTITPPQLLQNEHSRNDRKDKHGLYYYFKRGVVTQNFLLMKEKTWQLFKSSAIGIQATGALQNYSVNINTFS